MFYVPSLPERNQDARMKTSTGKRKIASVASILSASATGMQTAIDATAASINTVTSEAALKTTTSYLNNQISTIIGGAPATLDTLAEIGAALNNQNNFAGSITTALGNKAAATDVAALYTALTTQKANLSDYTSLSAVVDTKAATAAVDTSWSCSSGICR